MMRPTRACVAAGGGPADGPSSGRRFPEDGRYVVFTADATNHVSNDTTGATDVYVIRGPRGELLLPALGDVITDIDVKNGRITVDVPDGLDFQKPSPAPGTRRRARPKP